MPTVTIVIGANYGDEGKGQTVHSLSDRDTCVVRFNGGAQAGHTVEHHGSRNVFHQLGSGTYKGATTYLGPECIVSPSVYLMEKNKFPTATMCVDERSRITTFTDVIINRLRERELGANRHGSCGMGINETVYRHGIIPITLADINKPDFETRIRSIWTWYGPSRLIELRLEHLIDAYFSELTEQMVEESIHEMRYMYHTCIKVRTFDELAGMFSHFVFEGAQGLLLSERNMQWYPHLTRSDTGITNAMAILSETDAAIINSLDVIYLTRPYLTRHGAGPLAHEWDVVPYKGIVDDTNITNDWQGTIRYAPLNFDLMANQVKDDFNRKRLQATGHVWITCWDQIENEKQLFHITDGVLFVETSPDGLLHATKEQFRNFNVRKVGIQR